MNKIFFKKKRKTCLFVNFFLALFRCWCEKTLARTQEQVLNSAVLCLGLYRLLCFIRLPTIRGYVRAVWWVFTGFCFLATQSGNELELVSLWLSLLLKITELYPKRVLKSRLAITQEIVPFLCARTILLLTCFCLHWTESCMNCQESCRWSTPRLTGSRNIIFRLPRLMHFNRRHDCNHDTK